MKEMSGKKADFNDFRFDGLNWRQYSNKYLTMERVSDDKNKIVVKVADEHIIQTKFGYALILDHSHVVFLKSWQVNNNYYGTEVLLTREYFNVKEWGEHEDFDEEPENLDFNTWLETAKEQNAADEDGVKLNKVHWEK
jgi:hypothetical protein|nr:MAG TPA: hypothetical protein [Caudoviricetes sp.]